MNKLKEWFQTIFLTKIAEFSNKKYLVALRDGMVITVPFTILGSIFLIINNLPFEGWGEVVKPISGLLNAPVTVTFGLLSLIVVCGLSYQMAKLNKIDEITGTVIGLVSFILVMLTNSLEIDTSVYGSAGMFTAIIVALLSGEIMSFCIKRNWVIKLPDSVPPAVMKSFAALIPGSITILFFWLIRVVLKIDINALVTKLFAPLVVGINTFWGVLLVCFLMCALWTIGIHGNNVIGSISSPIFLTYLAANIEAVSNGQPAPYIAADGFLLFGMNLGGTGAIIGIALCMLTAKSERYRTLGKMSVLPSVFGISEPIMFGMPIVLNPIFMFPFIGIPILLQGITYLLMQYDLIGRVVASAPWTTPPIISGFLITGGDWRAALWQGIEVIIAVAIYYPFFKMADKQALKEETN